MGPFYLAPDGEVEYYQKWEMNLPTDVEVNGSGFPYFSRFRTTFCSIISLERAELPFPRDFD
jgi:hypothetical protein